VHLKFSEMGASVYVISNCVLRSFPLSRIASEILKALLLSWVPRGDLFTFFFFRGGVFSVNSHPLSFGLPADSNDL